MLQKEPEFPSPLCQTLPGFGTTIRRENSHVIPASSVPSALLPITPSIPQITAVCAPLRAVYPAALCTKSPSLLCEGQKNRKPRQCPPALLSTTRRGARPASGSLNMVTTRRAEGFSPPTTKGTEPPASVPPDADFICHTVGGTGAANGGGGAVWMCFHVC